MNNFFLITPKDLQDTKTKGCWSAENMASHGAEDSELTYIGSEIKDNGRVYDYYVDDQGRYWYRNRIRLPNSQIVTMEQHIFGREKLNKKKHRQ